MSSSSSTRSTESPAPRYAELPDTQTALEEEILERWKEENTFRRSLEIREGDPEFVFYEGPPTANGRPGVHHVISRTIKDLVARYRTMTGHHVTRIAGWDTHGLPVEIEAERELGISGKPEIEKLGVGEFNRVCRENIFTYKDEWERLSRRIAYWLDYERAYITCTPEYVESAWWAVSEIHERGLLYKGYKVLPYCPRCGTGLSSHEVAQGYRDRSDPSLYTLFPLENGAADAHDTAGEEPPRFLLTWTTTPWTLVSNVAVAYGPDVEYVEVEAVRREGGDAREERAPDGSAGAHRVRVILSRRRAKALAAESDPAADSSPAAAHDFEYAISREALEAARTVSHEELEELAYRRPLRLLPEEPEGAGRLHPADFVSDEEGTGFVHIAPAFGEDDFELGRERGLPVVRPVDDEGRFEAEVEEVGGAFVKDADDRLVELLAGEGLRFARGTVRHSYPHCWRCESPLLYMARDSWYVETTAVKDRLLEHNASVDWHPPEIGEGRMGEWLENNVDWALSRDRYWGTPLPVWECDAEEAHREVVGSLEDLGERAGGLPEDFDPHRPEIDEVVWPCLREGCTGRMRRVPQVLDAWFDSGAMPFAQWHYPFENREEFRRHFPADFIAEGVDQTRGWFYSLLALSTVVFDSPAYRAVVVNDLILDAEGRKMSKSRGNTVDPWEAIDAHGADAIRFFLISTSNPWLPKRWDPSGLEEVDRKLFDTLRNTYRFFAMYANLEGWADGRLEAMEPRPAGERPVMDRWLLSRLDTLAGAVRRDLDGYDLTRAARRLTDFVVDELSNWYVRRTRGRFWATRPTEIGRHSTADAFATLEEALTSVSLMLAPVAPFLPDWIHRQLSREGRSVHLSDFPVARGRSDRELEDRMEDARRLAALGRAAREEAGVRVRQPLSTVRVVLPEGRRLPDELTEILRDELNVRRVEFLTRESEIVTFRARPEFGSLGPRFGAETPAVARAVEALSGEPLRLLHGGERVTVVYETEDGPAEAEIGPEDVRIMEEARGELAVSSRDGYLAAVDPELDEDLRREGLARELVNRIQRLRRETGLEISDRIELRIEGPEDIEEAAREHREYIAAETLAEEDGEPQVEVRSTYIRTDEPEDMTAGEIPDDDRADWTTSETEIEGEKVHIGLRRIAPSAAPPGETRTTEQ